MRKAPFMYIGTGKSKSATYSISKCVAYPLLAFLIEGKLKVNFNGGFSHENFFLKKHRQWPQNEGHIRSSQKKYNTVLDGVIQENQE